MERRTVAKNIVICSDGTGSTFGRRASNVTHLVRCLDVGDRKAQVVIYDQGVGTARARTRLVRGIEGADQLVRLPAHARWNVGARLLGLLFGYGLRRNLREMYCELARCYEPGDRVFLFGFSRGAFTVRALAGLLHRCHLPGPAGDRPLRRHFRKAWRAYEPMQPAGDTVAAAREGARRCPIYFLGVWDTVKSYGVVRPRMLPHLRHNPSVGHVRHALALDERRGWFKATTWGLLDSDDCPRARLDPLDAPAFASQDVCEAWFAGSHGDVGGGPIALRWMLGEAARLDPPLELSCAGKATLRLGDPAPPPLVESTTAARAVWWLLDRARRKEIDNSGRWPMLVPASRDGARHPDGARRGGALAIHESAAGRVSLTVLRLAVSWSAVAPCPGVTAPVVSPARRPRARRRGRAARAASTR